MTPMLLVAANAGALGEAWGYVAPGTPLPADFEEHEFHVRGRLAGVEPELDWVRRLLAEFPAGLP